MGKVANTFRIEKKKIPEWENVFVENTITFKTPEKQ